MRRRKAIGLAFTSVRTRGPAPVRAWTTRVGLLADVWSLLRYPPGHTTGAISDSRLAVPARPSPPSATVTCSSPIFETAVARRIAQGPLIILSRGLSLVQSEQTEPDRHPCRAPCSCDDGPTQSASDLARSLKLLYYALSEHTIPRKSGFCPPSCHTKRWGTRPK